MKTMTNDDAISRFDTIIGDTPCVVEILYWEYFTPGFLGGPPENCYPDEGGYGEWVILDADGKQNDELDALLTDVEVERINQEAFDHMEGGDDQN